MGIVFVRNDAGQVGVVDHDNDGITDQRVGTVRRMSGFFFNGSFGRFTVHFTSYVPPRIQRLVFIPLQGGAFRVRVGGVRTVRSSFFEVATRRLRARAGSRRELARILCRFIRSYHFRIIRNDFHLSRSKGGGFVNQLRFFFVDDGRHFCPRPLWDVVREAGVTNVMFCGYCFRRLGVAILFL